MSDDHEIGFGKPPRQSQFKPGLSGNPKGRPRGSKNLKTDLAEEMQEQVVVREGGRAHKISKQRALIKAMTAKGLNGDPRSLVHTLDLVVRLLSSVEGDGDDTQISADDKAILEAYRARQSAYERRETSSSHEINGSCENGDDGDSVT